MVLGRRGGGALWAVGLTALGAVRECRAQIRILAPASLVQEAAASGLQDGLMVGSTATFGAPTYGQSFEGRLWYVPDEENSVYCTDDYIEKMRKVQAESGVTQGLRNVFVLRRGRCPFVTKVNIAEREGSADCVIMIDEASSDWSRADVQHVIMADDGRGSHVTIPSVLVSRQDGDLLVNAIERDPKVPVVVRMEWSLPQKHVVRVDFWTDAGRRDGVEFLREYAAHARDLSGRLSFNTHYNVFSLPIIGDTRDLCLTEAAQFCDDPPDGANSIAGRDVLMENVRQMCLWQVTAKPVGNDGPKESEKWWNYVEEFPKECPTAGPNAEGPPTDRNKPYRLGEDCSIRLMKKLSIDPTPVLDCARRDYSRLLTQQLGDKAWSVLALRINDVRFSGNLEPMLVTRAICSAFETTPAACKKYLNASSQTAIVREGVSAGGLFLLFVLSVVSLGVGMYVYQRYIRRSMRNSLRQEVMLEVKNQMQEYYQMGDDLNLPDDFRQSH